MDVDNCNSKSCGELIYWVPRYIAGIAFTVVALTVIVLLGIYLKGMDHGGSFNDNFVSPFKLSNGCIPSIIQLL